MDVPPSATAAPSMAGSRPLSAGRSRSRPRLSVVVVNYRHWDETGRLVADLRRCGTFRRGAAEVVVVDNDSPPHPLIRKLRRTSGVTLRRWRGNRGFARAVNEGCRLARGDWFLLLNPDTTPSPGLLDDVLDRAENLAPEVGIVGFQLRNPDGSVQLSTGKFPGFAGTLAGLLAPRHRRKYTPPAGDGLSRVDWVTGCCMLIRRECWMELGGFDPDFFLYYEDVDLCRRANEAGWLVAHDTGACVVHHHPLHTRKVPPHLRLITRHALLTYAAKHWPGRCLWAMAGVVRLESLARRLAAWWADDAEAGRAFFRMGRVADDLSSGRRDEARAELLREVRLREKRRVPSVHRDPVEQQAGPADALPAIGLLAQAAGHGSAGG